MLFDLSQYAYAFPAWPPVIVGAAVAVLAIAVLIRERASDVSLAYLALSASVSIWLLSFGGMYSTYNPNVARLWAHLEGAAVTFIPSLLFRFTLVIIKRLPKYQAWSRAALAASTVFALLALFGSSFISDVWRYPWGFYPLYGPASWPFLGLMAAAMIASLRLFWQTSNVLPGGQRRSMLRALFWAFSFSLFGAMDFLASYRVMVYPIGFLPVYTCLLILAQTIWQYNFADITASMAAPQILESLPSAVLVTDADGIISLANPRSTNIFGLSHRELIGSAAAKIVPGFLTPAQLASLQTQDILPDYDLTLFSASGEKRYLMVSLSTTKETSGRLLGYMGVVRDITQRRRAEDALRASEARFHRLVDANIIGFMRVTQTGRLLEANEAFLEMIGYARADLLAGHLGAPQITPPEHRLLDEWMAECLKNTGVCPPVEKEYLRKNGSRVAVLVGVVRLSEEEGDLCFVIDATDRRLAMDALRKARDEMELRVNERTTELLRANTDLGRQVEYRKRAEAALRSLSITDSLTGLYNRRGFLTLGEQLLKQTQRKGCAFLLFMADLDGLKMINDTYGHLEGDQALNGFTTILKDVFRSSDVVSRLGGDEFAIAVMDDSAESGAEVLQRRLAQRSMEWNAKEDRPYPLSFSLGVARREPRDELALETLLERADQALYEQKRSKAVLLVPPAP